MTERIDHNDQDCFSDWGGSITPPLLESEDEVVESQCVAPIRKSNLQPHQLPRVDSAMVPRFQCSESRNFKNDARLKVFQRLLTREEPYPNHCLFNQQSVRLYSLKIRTAEGLTQSYRRKLFLLCRQSIFRLRNIKKTPSKVITDQSYSGIYEETSNFLGYIHNIIFWYKSHFDSQPQLPIVKDYVNIIDSTLGELKTLLSAVGRIHIQSPSISNTEIVKENYSKRNLDDHICHLVLELNWHYVMILSEVCLRDDLDNDRKSKYVTILEDRCTLILWDLVVMAWTVFKQDRITAFSKSFSGTNASDLFPCSCCLEMLLSVIRILDEMSFQVSCQAFWSMFSQLCSSLQILSDKSSTDKDPIAKLAPSNFRCDEPTAFSWYLIKVIAPLYKYDVSGGYVYKQGMYVANNWLLVQDLLRSTFRTKEQTPSEKLAREALRSCSELAKIWIPCPDAVNLLWDNFHKRLNEGFRSISQGVLNVAAPSLSALQWMEKFHFDPNSYQHDRTRDIHLNSFELFLQILAIMLTKTSNMKDGNNQLWGQMKGRFYSKFHKKRIEDLSDVGLQNFISLFLTLASCVKTDDVVQKLCSFLNLVQNKSKRQSKSSTLIKGLYAVLHLQKKLQIVTSALTEKLKSDFQETCRDFAERHSDPTTRRGYWQLINLHLDSIEELVSGDGCIESEAGFFHVGESLSMIFSNCNDSEARRIASFVYRLLSSIRPRKNGNGCTDVDDFLWSGLYPWIQKSFTDKQLIQRIPESIADPAAGFTLLSVSSSGTNPSFKEMVLKFSGIDQPVRFVAKYICHLLSSSTTVDKIFQDDCQAIIIRSWFRCLIGITEKHPLSLELTRLIAQLPDVGKLVENEIRANNQSSENIIFSFIVAFGRQQANANQLSEIAELRKKATFYFGEILKNTESIISTGNPADSLRILYSVVGKLVKHCSKLIYSKTSPDCLLPKILDQMVLPRQSTKKAIPAAVTNCLVGHIHQFLSGLSSLDFKKDEFVRRKIKEIFSRYFLTITKRCHALPSSRNPFLVALQNACIQKPTSQASDFRQFVMEIIAENFLVLPQAPENHSMVLYFVSRLYQSSIGHKEIIRNSPSIMIQVMCSLISCDACGGANAEPPGIRKPAMEILTAITKAYKNATNDEIIKLQEQLQNVLLLNIQQFQGIVFKSFEALARLDRELARGLIATARQSVEENETSRGCGEDKRLRSALENFIASTGERPSNSDPLLSTR
eukprot:Seg2079.2 transcript_id=Seg2079.2/GoldUCD/mRNA.D3Y31 product="Protein MMS22-like" protein_id=Seg2079.2/GoldUCD/D3Y31